MGRIWAVCSGNGGVGKTTIALSLAAGAAHMGKRTILLDAAGVSRACDLLLGLESVITIDLMDVLTQQMEINAALYPVPACKNLRIVSASLCGDVPLDELSGALLALQSMCDVLVIDYPTGCLPQDAGLMREEDEYLLVVRPDDSSMRAAERMLQRARGSFAGRSLIINRIRRDYVKQGKQYAADVVCATLDCPALGSVAEDDGSVFPGFLRKGVTHGGAPHGVIREMLASLLVAR